MIVQHQGRAEDGLGGDVHVKELYILHSLRCKYGRLS